MSKTKIRFIDPTGSGRTGGTGIYGLPSEDNASGEFQIGDETEIEGDEIPAGWVGRAEIVGKGSKKDAEFVTGAEDTSTERGTESKDQADRPREDHSEGSALDKEKGPGEVKRGRPAKSPE